MEKTDFFEDPDDQEISKNTRNHNDFDVENLLRSLKQYSADPENLPLEQYLEAYGEFHKFFVHLGPIFGFVAKDVQNKIEILHLKLKDNNFTTVQSMVQMEYDCNKLNEQNYISASRTYLRLHRALHFVQLFILELANLHGDVRLDTSARNAYKSSLAKHHGWFIQQAVLTALYMMPTREKLLGRILGIEELKKLEESNELELKLKEIFESTSIAYELSEKLIQEKKIGNLP